MQFSLLNVQSSLYELSDRHSIMFYKNRYKVNVGIYSKLIAQKEYAKTLELLFSFFNFFFNTLKPTGFKLSTLSTGFSKKEQVHRSILSIIKMGRDKLTLFSFRFQNFLFLINMIYLNFYKFNAKFFIKKNRFFKNQSILFFSKLCHVATHSSSKISKSRASRTNYSINFFGSPVINSVVNLYLYK